MSTQTLYTYIFIYIIIILMLYFKDSYEQIPNKFNNMLFIKIIKIILMFILVFMVMDITFLDDVNVLNLELESNIDVEIIAENESEEPLRPYGPFIIETPTGSITYTLGEDEKLVKYRGEYLPEFFVEKYKAELQQYYINSGITIFLGFCVGFILTYAAVYYYDNYINTYEARMNVKIAFDKVNRDIRSSALLEKTLLECDKYLGKDIMVFLHGETIVQITDDHKHIFWANIDYPDFRRLSQNEYLYLVDGMVDSTQDNYDAVVFHKIEVRTFQEIKLPALEYESGAYYRNRYHPDNVIDSSR